MNYKIVLYLEWLVESFFLSVESETFLRIQFNNSLSLLKYLVLPNHTNMFELFGNCFFSYFTEFSKKSVGLKISQLYQSRHKCRLAQEEVFA